MTCVCRRWIFSSVMTSSRQRAVRKQDDDEKKVAARFVFYLGFIHLHPRQADKYSLLLTLMKRVEGRSHAGSNEECRRKWEGRVALFWAFAERQIFDEFYLQNHFKLFDSTAKPLRENTPKMRAKRITSWLQVLARAMNEEWSRLERI